MDLKKTIAFLPAASLILGTAGAAPAHSGKPGKHGGHHCSTKSKKKGLCTGYYDHR